MLVVLLQAGGRVPALSRNTLTRGGGAGGSARRGRFLENVCADPCGTLAPWRSTPSCSKSWRARCARRRWRSCTAERACAARAASASIRCATTSRSCCPRRPPSRTLSLERLAGSRPVAAARGHLPVSIFAAQVFLVLALARVRGARCARRGRAAPAPARRAASLAFSRVDAALGLLLRRRRSPRTRAPRSWCSSSSSTSRWTACAPARAPRARAGRAAPRRPRARRRRAGCSTSSSASTPSTNRPRSFLGHYMTAVRRC